MSLVDRVDAGGHSIRRFRAAARMRYQEGLRLANNERLLGSVYLWGYVAEMLLKGAYFRLVGFGDNDVIQVADMYVARNRALNVFGVSWPGNLHDLSGWSALLIEEHDLLGRPLRADLRMNLNAHISRVNVNWREDLRYHPNRPSRREFERVLDAVTWLRTHFRYL